MSKIPGPGSYVELLDNQALESGQKNAQINTSPIRPSNAGACARRIAHDYLAFLGKGEKLAEERKPNVERLLKLGHFVEDHVLTDMREIPLFNVRFSQQLIEMFTLPHGTQVEGSTDVVTWSDETRGVGDVKSMGDRWHNHFASKWDGMLNTYKNSATEVFGSNSFFITDMDKFLKDITHNDPLYKNIVQVNLYACSDFLQKRGVDHAFILRYNKNNSSLMEIRFKPNTALYKDTKRRLSLVEEAGVQGNVLVAPKERVLGNMDCTYCPYKESCWPLAQKRDFYMNNSDKKWAIKTSDLQSGKKIEALLSKRSKLEYSLKDLHGVDEEIILLMDKCDATKIKTSKGEVFEVKTLKYGVELRRSKE